MSAHLAREAFFSYGPMRGACVLGAWGFGRCLPGKQILLPASVGHNFSRHPVFAYVFAYSIGQECLEFWQVFVRLAGGECFRDWLVWGASFGGVRGFARDYLR